jgi:hypothetical protein
MPANSMLMHETVSRARPGPDLVESITEYTS